MGELFNCFSDFLGRIVDFEPFLWFVAAFVVFSVCSLIRILILWDGVEK